MQHVALRDTLFANTLPSLQHRCYWNYGADCKTAPPSVTGNLLWLLSVVHMNAVYSGNSTLDVKIVFPLLDRALQFYQHFQVVAADGTITLPVTFSPEWPGGSGPDSNYDKSLYRWGLATAISLADEFSLSSPHLQAWRDTLAKISWFAVDPETDTFEIYDGVPYNQPHRHFSHLFMIWPLRLIDASNASQYATARNSINLWLATPEEDSQFYRPAASAMNNLLGQRAAAFDNITFLLHTRIEGSTFYREGAQGSCTETPYAAAWAVTDWLVQSWNLTSAAGGPSTPARIIDFFPGVDDVIRLDGAAYDAAPAKVATAAFYRLAVEGAVLASAARALVVQNATHFVTRTSFLAVERLASAPASAPLVVRTNMARPLASSPAGVTLTELGDGGLVLVGLGAGEGAAIFSAAQPPPSFAIAPAGGCAREFNHWGVPQAAGGGPGVGGTPVALRACVVDGNGLAAPKQRFAWNATAGQFALQDGSGRCLSVSTCDASNGDRVTVAPCAAQPQPPPPPPAAGDIGCDAGAAPASCAAQSQQWSVTGPSGAPPNAIKPALATSRCIDVNGATQRDVIDVWDCGTPPGAYKNEEFAYNITSGSIQSYDSDPDCACLNFCITPNE